MFTPDGGLEPLIAEKFDQPDEVTYVYTLRDGVVFSDGTPVTIDDVVASIARVRDPEVAGPLAWMYDVPEATVERTDDKTITITLTTPSALFRYVPATTAGHVIPAAAIEQYGLDLLRNPIGTGPYKFVKLGCRKPDRAGEEPELLAGRQTPLRPLHLQDRRGGHDPRYRPQERRTQHVDATYRRTRSKR